MNRYSILGLMGLCMSATALADMPPTGIQLGQPIMGGSGCPAGTASAVLSPDNTTLSIIFDQYSVESGSQARKTIDRKNCDIAIPLQVPQGFSVSIFDIDYRGFNALPQGGQSRFTVDYFFAGSRGPGFMKTFYGPLNEDFLLSNQVAAQAVVWSACGASTNLRINSSMMVQTNAYQQQALATVDSTDVKSALVYQLQWRRCDGGYPSPIPAPPVPAPGYPGTGPYTPDPGSYTGNCSIDQDPRSGMFFVRDINQNLVGRAYDYAEAVRMAQDADASGRCLARPSYPPSNPYPSYPPSNPYPSYPSDPYPSYPSNPYGRSCTLTIRGSRFVGTGYDQGSAMADARNQCIRAYNNSRMCMSAPVMCR